MAGRDLKELLAAYRDRDDLAFRRAAQAIIEEEESKRHTALAKDLRRLLASGSGFYTPLDTTPKPEAPRNRDSDLPLAEVLKPTRGFRSLSLRDNLASALDELVSEVFMWPQLDAASIPRRRSVLLYGPPGCGKTSIAESVATELSRTFVIIKSESIISSYLGETASNIARVFDFAESGPFVILFDEFDSLGKTRDDASDHGELRRVVNSVLQKIDRYNGPSLIFAATNHENLLDAALWRRFDEVLEVSLPSLNERTVLLSKVLMGRSSGTLDLTSAARALEGLPHAAVERAGFDALRVAVLDGRKVVTTDDLQIGVDRTLDRRWI